ncbi:hypothetical protein KXX11_004381, partial [Aspergillus fumigatus]
MALDHTAQRGHEDLQIALVMGTEGTGLVRDHPHHTHHPLVGHQRRDDQRSHAQAAADRQVHARVLLGVVAAGDPALLDHLARQRGLQIHREAQ